MGATVPQRYAESLRVSEHDICPHLTRGREDREREKISADCNRLEASETLLKGDPVRDVALAAAGPDGVAVVTGSQWAGWTDGKPNTTDPGPATVALVKLPAHP